MVKADNPDDVPAKATTKPSPKKEVVAAPAHHPVVDPVQNPVNDNGLPLVSMILGLVSIATFMVFLGIPAIILGIIGLKKYPETNRAYSITGIITGIVSTLLMVLFTVFIFFAVIIGLSEASTDTTLPEPDNWSDRYQSEEAPGQFYHSRQGI